MMDRRTFLTGVGSAGALGAIATGVVVNQSNPISARANGLATAAGANNSAIQSSSPHANKAVAVPGLAVGFLPGSTGMFATPDAEPRTRVTAADLSWSVWDSADATIDRSRTHSLFKVSRQVDVSIGAVHANSTIAALAVMRRLDIVAHFATDDALYFVPFNAAHFESADSVSRSKSTQPLSFVAQTPDRVALEINYALNPAFTAGGISSTGNLYLPIGGQDGNREGLAIGLYVLATPATATGVPPVLSDFVFSGNVRAPLLSRSGAPLDFDYLTLAIRPTDL